MRKLIVCIALLATASLPGLAEARAAGQTPAAVDATHLPAGVLDLGAGWRTHGGDNLAWAQPDFDDSGWRSVNLDQLGPAQFGWRWFRLRVHLGADHPPLDLLLQGGQGTYEIYLNGQRAPGAELRPLLGATHPTEQVFALPDTPDVVIALRTRALDIYVGLHERLFLSASMGPPHAIETERTAFESQRLDLAIPSIAINLLLMLAGLGVFALWRSQRGHKEYLWLALYLLALGASNFLTFTSGAGLGPDSWATALGDPLIYAFTLMQIEFTFAFADRRIGRAWRAYEILLLAMVVPSELTTFAGFPASLYVVMEAVAILPAALLLPVLLFVWYRWGNREAGWLIVPSLFPAATWALSDLGLASVYTGWGYANFLADGYISLGPVQLQVPDLGDLLFLLAIAVVMFFRFTRVNREQARAAAELEAAQKVQSLLVHAARQPAPGWQVNAVYRPAGEVGGDFYHVAPRADGSALIVLGDVSGKGVEAALRVAVIIGALHETTAESPPAVLEHLNSILRSISNGGFTTCLCARISPDGTVALANAGHLSPYRNGDEVEMVPDVPLGITEAAYAETCLRLMPGERLTFLSDGIVEARNGAGELFGFDRTRAISTQSAEEIAHAAQEFGQEDDITVLTVTFGAARA